MPTPNTLPLDPFSSRTYSQNGEDGIIAEILRRLHITTPTTAVEIGVGDGRQCNTRLLRENGWRVVMVDGKLNHAPPDNIRAMVTVDNVARTVESAIPDLQAIDLFSIDIDGNDWWVLRALLTGVPYRRNRPMRPAVIIHEYNGQLPPACRLSIAYDPQHAWDGSMYYGASLGAFHSLLNGNYRLVYMNGINAFWVRRGFGYDAEDLPPICYFEDFRIRPGRPFKVTEKIRGFVEVR
jgi:hypothetical protein